MNAELAQAQAILNGNNPNPDKALKVLSPLLKRQNKPWMLYHFLGVANLQKKNYEKAIQYLAKAVEKGSTEPETVHLMSMGYKELGDYEQAIQYAYKALHKNEEFVQAWMNLGAVYRAMADLDNALKAYQRANQLDKKNPAIAFRLASIYTDQGDHVKGQKLYEITIKMDPEYIEAYLGLAQIQQRLFRFEQAVETIKKALEYDPKSLITRVELATGYKAMGDYDEAIRINKELIDEYPKLGLLRVNYALCFQEIGRFNEAEENYRKAFEVDPTISESISNYLMAIHYNPERTKQEIFDAHLLWDQYFAPKERPKRPVPKNLDPNKKLRIGFLSGGFRKHPVGWMIVRAIENLPDDQIEVYGYTTHSLYDYITNRIQEKAKKWTPVIGYNDEVVAQLIRDDEIDILVELSGHASLNRLKTVALEPAPITVKWVGGLFNTTGMKSMDYLLTDSFETPEGEEEFYTEKLVRMPEDYIVYEVPNYEGIVLGELPAKENGHITFGCFNNPTKINEVLLAHWANLMQEVPGSKLFLKSKQYDTQTFVQNIIEQMKRFGIEESRLIFEGQSLHDELLNSYNKIDIALDPWPYSGGLTTCESLWMGVPVVTMSGPTFAGRHSTSHLQNAGFPEWVTDNWEDYKKVVLDLVSDLDKLGEIRKGLRNKVLDSPLCDGRRFAAHLSVAFREMWKQRVKGYEQNREEGEWQNHIEIPQLTNADIDKLLSGSVYSPGHRSSADSLVIENTLIRNTQGLQISLPENLKELSTYAYSETNSWLDEEIDFVSGFLKKGMNVMDIGASYGAYSLPMANKVGFQGKVYAFEPMIEMATHIQESAEVNQFKQIEIIPKAVSLETGFISFKEDEIVELSRIDHAGETTVESLALDEFWLNENKPDIDLIKVDVNGSEISVIESAMGLISDQKPVLIISTSPELDEVTKRVETIQKMGYQLFEYVSELQVLAPYEGQPSSSFSSNLIAIHTKKVNSNTFVDWIYQVPAEKSEVEPGAWKSFASTLKWVDQLPVNWSSESFSQVDEEYLSALDYVASAEELLRNPFSNYCRSNIQATEWMLTAAGKLIDLMHNGKQTIELQFTLSRVLLKLGKRDNAVAILKTMVEQLLSGQEMVDFKTPFFLPFSDQDFTTISHDPFAWLKIKALEAWLLLKVKSTYFSQPKDIQYLQGLSGNPDSVPQVDKIVNELIPKKSSDYKTGGKFIHIVFNHVYSQSLSDLIEYTNGHSDQSHTLYVEHHQAIEGYSADISRNSSSKFFDCFKHADAVVRRCLAEDVDGVIFHGIFLDYQKEMVTKIGDKKHIGWVLWGGDLYRPIKEDNPLHEVASYVNSIHTPISGDVTVFEETYGARNSFEFGYPYPGLYGNLRKQFDKKDPPVIIVGNSGDSENCHLEIIKNLASKKDIDRYQIVVPVSYNFLPAYEKFLLKEVQKLGFEDKIIFERDFVDPAVYFEKTSRASLLLTAHNRQQAMGNMLTSFYCGNSTVLRKQIRVNGEMLANPSWEFLVKHGFNPIDFEEFKSAESIQSFLAVGEDQTRRNQQNIEENFGIETRANQLIRSCKKIIDNQKLVSLESL